MHLTIFLEYYPDATQSNPAACPTSGPSSSCPNPTRLSADHFTYSIHGSTLQLVWKGTGPCQITLIDMRDKVFNSFQREGSNPLELKLPSQNGVYVLRIKRYKNGSHINFVVFGP